MARRRYLTSRRRVGEGGPWRAVWPGLDGGHAAFPGADTDGLVDLHHPDLAVARTAGVGAGHDDVHQVPGLFVGGEDLDANLGVQVHRIFGSPVDFGVAALSPVAVGTADRQPLDAEALQRVADIVELFGPDDGR